MGNPLLGSARLGTLVRLARFGVERARGERRVLADWVGFVVDVAVVGVLFARRQARRVGRRLMAEVPPSFGVLAAVTTVALAAIIVQTPLAHLSAPIADGSPFGTITFAFLLCAPWGCGAGCGIAGAGCLGGSVVDGRAAVRDCGVWLRLLGKSFAQWVHGYPAIFGGCDSGCGSTGAMAVSRVCWYFSARKRSIRCFACSRRHRQARAAPGACLAMFRDDRKHALAVCLPLDAAARMADAEDHQSGWLRKAGLNVEHGPLSLSLAAGADLATLPGPDSLIGATDDSSR